MKKYYLKQIFFKFDHSKIPFHTQWKVQYINNQSKINENNFRILYY